MYCGVEWIDKALPWILPPDWKLVDTSLDGARFINKTKRMSVIASGNTELDGKRWLHVSLARPDFMPSYEDVKLVKELFIGEENKAIQVFPPKSEHVNIHVHCLHLWHCLDGDPLPDFTQGGKTL